MAQRLRAYLYAKLENEMPPKLAGCDALTIANDLDETLAGTLSDDELAKMFLDPKWEGVRTIFLLDTCHAGGFIGTSVADIGDINRLKDFALFASAKEDQLSFGTLDPLAGGMGLWTDTMLLPALDLGLDLTALELNSHIFSSWTVLAAGLVGTVLPVLDVADPGTMAPFGDQTPFFYASPDFDVAKPHLPVSSVPEGAWTSFAYLLGGLLFLTTSCARMTIRSRG